MHADTVLQHRKMVFKSRSYNVGNQTATVNSDIRNAKMADISRVQTIILVLCSFILLTTEVQTFSKSKNSKQVVTTQELTDENNTNLTFSIKEQLNANESLIVPVPRIIAELGRLMGASMGQLDSALSWPDGAPKMVDNVTFTSSPLIEYSQSFKTTILQIIHRLTQTLRTMNSNSDRMALQVVSVPSFINTVQRYLTHFQKSSLFFDLISIPLNELKELSEKNVMSSNQTSYELEKIVNLTNALSDFIDLTHSAKSKYISDINEEIPETKVNKDELQEEINFLNKTYEEWSHNTTELEKQFYNTLDYSRIELDKGRNNTVPSCVQLRLQGWRDIKEVLQIKNCTDVITNKEKTAVAQIRDVKWKWKYSMGNMTETLKNWTAKRKEHHNLAVAIQLLERKKEHFDRDIDLLANSSYSINRLLKDMKELQSGWNTFASLCSAIQLHVSEVRTALLPSNSSTSGTKKSTSEKLLQQVNKELEKIRQDMESVGKMAKFYVNVYDADLHSLAAQLDRMVTIRNVDSNELKDKLIDDCQQAENILTGKSTNSIDKHATERLHIFE